MDLAARKRIEIERKLDSLSRELAEWRARSEAQKPLEKHHSQIRRLTTQLEALERKIAERMKAPPNGKDILTECERLEKHIAVAHRIWGFFRSKLVLRAIDWFKDHLAVADELAWACYEPARRRLAESARREPPLAFFSGAPGAFMMPRDSAYTLERGPGEDEDVGAFDLEGALKALPIPVIGVPWSQIEHLPEALVICHEVGHLIEHDFGLSDTLGKLLKKALANDPARFPAFQAWLSEMFADVYGTVAAGPAFAGALADCLAASPAGIQAQHRSAPPWGTYPTRTLRVLFIAKVLEKRGFTAAASALEGAWKTTYPSNAMAAFVPDLDRIAGALLEGPYPELGGAALSEVLAFTSMDQAAAEDAADAALRKRALTASDPRVLVAASRIAFEKDAAAYAQSGVQKRVVDRVKAAQTAGVRGKPRAPGAKEADTASSIDKAAGEALYAELVSALEAPPPP